ncbi:hypothetical protein [Corynebacterium amycolatum]|uniref:hypothetical protein n=1 Tax=Corynebacterium amycolatum TaxID=43765 RepID=UPI0038352545
MTTTPKITTTESTTSRNKRRRRAAHSIIRSTEAGNHTMCGKFISRQDSTPVKVDSDGVPLSVEYYPCPACRHIRDLEKDMEGHWPIFRIPSSLALDIVDIAQPKDTAA